MKYHGEESALIHIEINADENDIIIGATMAQISNINVDNRIINNYIISFDVKNTGERAGVFTVNIVNCPENIKWNSDETTKTLIIPSKHHGEFQFELDGNVPLEKFQCDVEVVNSDKVLLAQRSLTAEHANHCLCVLHCDCVCAGSYSTTKCKTMDAEKYHEAGFIGVPPPPVFVTIDENKSSRHWILHFLHLLLFILLLLLLLLFLGLLKALFGLICIPIRFYGMERVTFCIATIFGENEEISCSEVCDCAEKIKKQQRKRMENMDCFSMFCMNLLFFFIYPILLICDYMSKYCDNDSDNSLPFMHFDGPGKTEKKPKEPHNFEEFRKLKNNSKNIPKSEKQEKIDQYNRELRGESKPRTSHEIDSEHELQDTEYVLDKMRKSEETLQKLNSKSSEDVFGNRYEKDEKQNDKKEKPAVSFEECICPYVKPQLNMFSKIQDNIFNVYRTSVITNFDSSDNESITAGDMKSQTKSVSNRSYNDSDTLPELLSDTSEDSNKTSCLRSNVTSFSAKYSMQPDALAREADDLVHRLLKARIVFLHFDHPIGGVDTADGVGYCIRGYFFRGDLGTYRFIAPMPLKQYWSIVDNKAVELEIPIPLDHTEFQKVYDSSLDILKQEDLSIFCRSICINVLYLNTRKNSEEMVSRTGSYL